LPVGDAIREEQTTAIFNPEGTKLLSYGRTARLWDTATGKPLCDPLPHNELCRGQFSPDGRVLLTHTSSMLHLWDAATGAPIGSPLRLPSLWRTGLNLGFRSGGRDFVAGWTDPQLGEGQIQRFDTATGQPAGPVLRCPGGSSVRFTQDGSVIVSSSEDGTVRLWETESSKLIAELVQAGRPTVSHKGQVFAAADEGQSQRLWEAGTGQPLGLPLQPEGFANITMFSPDGRCVLSRAKDNTSKLSRVPEPLAGDVASIKLRIQVTTGLDLGESGTISPLTAVEWRKRYEQRRVELASAGNAESEQN
jgi:WD40 repeat protein